MDLFFLAIGNCARRTPDLSPGLLGFFSLLPLCCVPLRRFNKNFLTLQIPLKEGTGGEREGEDRVTLQITLIS